MSTSIDVDGLLKTYDELRKYEAGFSMDNFYDKSFKKIALKRWILASAHFCARVMSYKEYKKTMRRLMLILKQRQLQRCFV